MTCPPWLPQRGLKPALAHLPCSPPQRSRETLRYHADYSANVAEPGLNALVSEVRERSQPLLGELRRHSIPKLAYSAAIPLANFGIEEHCQFVAPSASLVQMSSDS